LPLPDLQLICFDCDGTLYNPVPLRRAMAWQLACRHFARPLAGYRNLKILTAYRRALELLREAGGNYLPEKQLELCCRLAGCPEGEVRQCVEEWFEHAPLDVLKRCVRPGLKRFLSAARDCGIKRCIFSDYPADMKLSAMGLDEYFDLVVCARDAQIRALKPDPAGLRFVLHYFAIGPSSAVYVGDRPEVDAEAARRAGVRAFIVGGNSPAPPCSWTGFSDFAELQALLKLHS
jgi:FMN phosphatase YigB (HAD superfamily)